jgi:tetratricopeptide (TPR) repeat protein
VTDPALRAKRCQALLGLTRVHTLLGDAEHASASAQATTREANALLAADPANPELRGLLGEVLVAEGNARQLANDDEGAKAAFAAASDHLAASALALPAQFGCRHASALRSAAMTAPPASDERMRGLRSSLQVLDGLQSVAPAADVATEYVLSACELGEALSLLLRLAESEAVLQQAAARLPLVTTERLHLTYRTSSLRAAVAFEGGERRSTLQHFEAALAAVSAWEVAQPKRILPRALHVRGLRSLGFAQNYAGEFEASVASYREAIALGEQLPERFPGVASQTLELALLLEEFALTLLDRFDQDVLVEAAACADRAVHLEQRASGAAPSERRWRLLCLRATIADARSTGGGDAYWPDVELALVRDPQCVARDQDLLVGAYASLSRWHLDHGRTELATQWLAKAAATIATDAKQHAKRAVEVGWLEARLAAARSDHAACAAAADRVLTARSTWYGRRRAADCLHLAWQCASKDPASAAAAITYRDRALDWYRRVRDSLDKDVTENGNDPWFVLPWGIASVRAAELSAAAGDVEAARSLLAAALPRLDAVRAKTHADLWDERAWRDGRALHGQLAATGR